MKRQELQLQFKVLYLHENSILKKVCIHEISQNTSNKNACTGPIVQFDYILKHYILKLYDLYFRKEKCGYSV